MFFPLFLRNAEFLSKFAEFLIISSGIYSINFAIFHDWVVESTDELISFCMTYVPGLCSNLQFTTATKTLLSTGADMDVSEIINFLRCLNAPIRLYCDVYIAYCTNIHPAESWQETFDALKNHALKVKDILEGESPLLSPFPLAPRLSARAAAELLEGENLAEFQHWCNTHHCRVFTINGFPFGAFHNTRVKEQVYRPDWSERSRLDYTLNLFRILAPFIGVGEQGSVSSLPGSFKAFAADEKQIFAHLIECADFIEKLSVSQGCDFHLGLEPEPLGHFENTSETIAFFARLFAAAPNPEVVRRRIGVNYDTCHFALEYDDCVTSLNALREAGIRISKVHLSAALALDPHDENAINALRAFDEPTYLHQVLLRQSHGEITRFADLPDFFAADAAIWRDAEEARVHFHIPLDADPRAPLRSTRDHAQHLLAYAQMHPDFCQHYEIETYTWGILPDGMQRPIEQHLAAEYRWVLQQISS